MLFLDSFSSLDDLKGKDRSDPLKLLAALAKVGRFSCFEVDRRMAGPITWLLNESGWVTPDNETIGYPWTKVTLTDEGRAQLLEVPGAQALLDKLKDSNQ